MCRDLQIVLWKQPNHTEPYGLQISGDPAPGCGAVPPSCIPSYLFAFTDAHMRGCFIWFSSQFLAAAAGNWRAGDGGLAPAAAHAYAARARTGRGWQYKEVHISNGMELNALRRLYCNPHNRGHVN